MFLKSQRQAVFKTLASLALFAGVFVPALIRAASPDSLPASQEETTEISATLAGKGKVVVEKAAEIDLDVLVKNWAFQMDHFYAETTVESKDTVKKVFDRLGIQDKSLTAFLNKLKPKENPFLRMQPGRLIVARLSPSGELINLRLFRPLDAQSKDVTFFEISKKEGGRFAYETRTERFDSLPIATSGVVRTSLNEAADRAKIPGLVLRQLKEQLSASMDLTKEVREGDRFSVIYERRQLDGLDLGSGRLLGVEYYTKGRKIEAYWYSGEDAEGYYDSEGNSTEVTFLRMPTEARVTSSFNRVRRHPVTGRLRPHWGIDLGAPTGTPVYAAGDGVITEKRYERYGYGYWIGLTHSGGYTSVYAHMSRYAEGIKTGMKVKKGQIIGYVGSSGLTTGPHLHYELKKEGRQINPLIADLRTGDSLKDEALAEFKTAIAPSRRQLAMLNKVRLAQTLASVSLP